MTDPIRKAFEKITYPTLSFVGTDLHSGLARKLDTGEYVSVLLEDHWQTFQEGPVVGTWIYNAGKEHVQRLREWMAEVDEEGYTVKFEVM